MAANTLSKLFVRVGADTSEFSRKMGKMQGKMKKMGSSLTKTGGALTKFVTGPIVGAGAAIGALATKTGNYADSVLDLNAATGLSTDKIQEWQAIASRAGTNTDVLTDASQELVKAMSRGDEGSANMVRGLEKLGLTFNDLEGATPDERMDMIIKALRGVEDPTQRAIIGQQLLKNSYEDLAPILDMSADKIDKVKQEANESGKVMSGDALTSANSFREGMDELKQQLIGAGRSIATQLMPILNEKFIPLVKEKIIPAVKSFVEKIVGIIETFSNLPKPIQKAIGIFVGLLAALGPILIIVGQLITAISSIMPIIAAVGGVISGVALGPIALIAGAVVGLIAVWKYWDEIVEFVKGFANMIMDIISPFTSGLVNAFTGMKDAVIGVFEFMWSGIKKIINWVIDGVNKMITGLNKIHVDVPGWAQKIPGVGKGFGFNIDTIPKLATGGAINTSGLGIVGENGPELLNLPKGATVSGAEALSNETNINIDNMTVRKESDINKIAKELDYLQKKKDRRLGP